MKNRFSQGVALSASCLIVFAGVSCQPDTIQEKDTVIPVTSLSLDKTSAALYVDDELELEVTIQPKNATEVNLVWESSEEKVATVDEDGIVTGLSEGKTRIRVRTEDGKVSATCRIEVWERTPDAVGVTGITLNAAAASLEVGETLTLTATVSPANADNKAVNWSTSDASVATVADGTVKAASAGTAVIKAVTVDGGFEAACTVTVVKSGDEPGPDDPTDRVRWADTGANVPAYPSYNAVSSYSDFPRVDISVSGGITSKTTYKPGTVKFFDPKNMYSKVAELTASGQFRGRGNSSWDYAEGGKRPYRIKLDENNKVFGMGGDRDWILLADSMDPSQLRNEVAQRIARLISMDFAPRFRTVELYINNDYQGSYTLIEHKETGLGHKVFVSPVDPASSVTDGGYFVELDAKGDDPVQFTSTTFRRLFNFKDPEQPNSAQKTYFQNLVNDTEAAMKAKNWDKVHSLIEMDTWIKNYIVQELTMNVDGNMRLSTYLAKDKDTKLYIPMVWDFDLAIGNASYLNKYCGTNGPEGWFIKDCGGNESNPKEQTYYQYLFQDPAFVARLKELWNLYKPRLDMIPGYIDKMQEYNAPAFQHAVDAGKNPRVRGYRQANDYFTTYQEAISYMKDYYEKRLAWLHTNINAL